MHIAELGAVEEQTGEHEEGYVDALFFAVYLNIFVLVVGIVKADGDVAALAGDLVGSDDLAVEGVGEG